MKIIYRTVKKADLPTIIDLESAAFHMNKEMTEKDMIGRIENYPDTFLVAEDEETGKIVGHTFGPAFAKRYIEDKLYFKNHPNRAEDKYQMILSIVVAPEYRHRGIASHLLDKMMEIAKSQGRVAISLTCYRELFPFYESNGFVNEGKTHDLPDPDGKQSYNMLREV